jgi:hypothetical protein
VQAVLHSVAQPAAAADGVVSFSVVDASSADAPAAWQVPPQWMQVRPACYFSCLFVVCNFK